MISKDFTSKPTTATMWSRANVDETDWARGLAGKARVVGSFKLRREKTKINNTTFRIQAKPA